MKTIIFAAGLILGAMLGIAYLLYRMLGPWWKKGFRL